MMNYGCHQYLEQCLLSCANFEPQLYTNFEQQLLLPTSAASSLPSMSNQTTTINIITPPSLQDFISPLSEFLVHPVTHPCASNTPIAPKRSVPKARLLTSHESLAMLEEKKKAKRDALILKRKGKRLKELQKNNNERRN